MKLQENEKLVMIGDSITDGGRSQPAGEGLFGALGNSYVSFVDALINSTYPELNIRIVNKGTSGNTVRNLKDRWQTDVLDLKPDWLSIMIGTNDVWRQYDSPTRPEEHVYIEEYEATLDSLVASAKAQGIHIVMLTPFFIEPNENDAMRATMDKYGRVVERLSKKHETLFGDTQAAFNKALEHVYSGTLAWDRVHPTLPGHAILAKTFLKTIEFEW